MQHLDGIMKLAETELASIVNNGKFRSREEITSVGELIDIAKDIYCIWDYDEGESYDDMSYAGRSYRRDGGSYARGRGRNARRDSMGRYSRDGHYRDGYSRADGKREMIENLHEMMDDAPDDKTRQEIQRLITKMEQA